MPEAGTVRVDAVETQRQRAEAPLRWAEDRYRLATEAGKVAVWRMDLASGRFETDGSLERIIGYAPGEIGVEPAAWQKVTHPDDLERTTRFWQQASEGITERYDCEYRLLHKDGSVRWVDVRGAGQKDGTGRVVSLTGTTWDITERKRAEAVLRENEAVRQQALESSPDAVFAIDREYRLLFNNQRHQRALVASGGQPFAVGDNVLSPAYTPEMLDQWRAAYDRALHGEEFRLDTEWMNLEGEPLLFENTFSPLRDASGEIIGVLVVAHDVTARRQAEEKFRASEDRFRVAVAAATIVVFNQDRDLRYTWIGNPALGFTGDETIGRTDKELVGVEMAEPLTAIKRRVLETGRGERQEVMVARAGQSGWFDLMAEPLRDAAGQIVGITCAALDITPRKRLEAERAAVLARLAVVEEQERQRLSRELHDQTAQRLVALAVELKTLETNLAAGRPQAERVRTLRKAVDDLQQQVRQLAWDLRAGELVEGGLETALREYVEDWSERSAVSVDCECRGLDGPPLPAPVEATLYRVAQEALANVEKHAQARRVSVLLERDETLVRLTVEDDGRGFAVDAVQDAPDSRLHLGLLGMHERVALVGGTLLIESSPGSGTTILVRIPLATEAKSS